jgi:hypothetical protein
MCETEKDLSDSTHLSTFRVKVSEGRHVSMVVHALILKIIKPLLDEKTRYFCLMPVIIVNES